MSYRNKDMKDLIKHELGPISYSLSTNNGMFRKTNKAALSEEILKVSAAVYVGCNTACIIGWMAIFQKTVIKNKHSLIL